MNGIDIRSLKQKSLRGHIGVVPQNTSLFNDTLKSNIRYGNQDATDDEIMQVVGKWIHYMQKFNYSSSPTTPR